MRSWIMEWKCWDDWGMKWIWRLWWKSFKYILICFQDHDDHDIEFQSDIVNVFLRLLWSSNWVGDFGMDEAWGSWDHHQMELVGEIVGDFGMWLEILRSSNGVGDRWRFWNVVWDLDHQMELRDFGMWFEILRSSNGVGDFWNVIWDLVIIKWSWDFGMWFEILWSSNGVGDFGMWLEIMIIKLSDGKLWRPTMITIDWRLWNDCYIYRNNVVNLSIHPSIHHD
jgi:hypothetical protein